jgi:hypothetical protein
VIGEWPTIDSRQYIVALKLRSIEDCPPDFVMPPHLAGFDAGLFLPRDDPDWFGQSSYPPCILLLKDGTLHIVSHPSAGEPPRRWELERISSVESGHMLLRGWLRFTGSGFDCTVRYNTRGLPPVLQFMQSFRAKLLGGARPPHETPVVQFGASLDIKFANALQCAIGLPACRRPTCAAPGAAHFPRSMNDDVSPSGCSAETVLMQIFQPPREVRPGRWLLSRRRRIAGDLLALTDRRLLWITDRDRGSYSRFGSIASYAPFDAVASIGVTSGRTGDMLQVDLKSGTAWQLPMASESREERQRIAYDFAAALEIQKSLYRANFTTVSMRRGENLI